MANDLLARIEASRTSVFKVIFPNTTNHYNTLFGGKAQQGTPTNPDPAASALRSAPRQAPSLSHPALLLSQLPAGSLLRSRLGWPNDDRFCHPVEVHRGSLELMDEVAFIAATRFSRKKVVTLSSDRIDFKEPIPADTIMELVAQVSSVGTTSLQVRVEIFQEEMYRPGTRRKSITGQFIFVALDEHNKPTSVL